VRNIGLICIVLLSTVSCHKPPLTTYTSGELVHFDPSNLHEDKKILKLIAPYKVQLDSQMNEVVGYCAESMTKYRPESPLGNAVCDMLVHYSKNVLSVDVDVCVMNFGGLRTALNPGEITRGKVYELMPFDNSLVVVELTQKQLDELAAHILLRGGEPISGSKQVRITEANGYAQFMINQAINIKNSYQLVTSNYLANGGDGFSVFTESAQKKDLNILIRDALIYEFEHGTSKDKPLSAVVEGRIPNKLPHE
jgi:2',3'-cyclic-nucleotide 2'-phosphodiesterase (5'-nucleotidase family)